jgi:hypothetical protein
MPAPTARPTPIIFWLERGGSIFKAVLQDGRWGRVGPDLPRGRRRLPWRGGASMPPRCDVRLTGLPAARLRARMTDPVPGSR